MIAVLAHFEGILYKIHEKNMLLYVHIMLWYAAFLQMILQEQKYQSKNKTYYGNYLEEQPLQSATN